MIKPIINDKERDSTEGQKSDGHQNAASSQKSLDQKEILDTKRQEFDFGSLNPSLLGIGINSEFIIIIQQGILFKLLGKKLNSLEKKRKIRENECLKNVGNKIRKK
ncbi:hypothetical protein AVEN_242901-1 [Araneus ventricosus]|uniref:Uncharacterized protein n=1 Tax=Araneus ventricosus TaxID=182803 RepID=A0A4Y2H7D9_ARAVE|nr:hypothetical protein AVEN_242901-1 [Araneus ventricosus]